MLFSLCGQLVTGLRPKEIRLKRRGGRKVGNGNVRNFNKQNAAAIPSLCIIPLGWLRASGTIYSGIGTKAETGVRNGWYRARDLNLPE